MIEVLDLYDERLKPLYKSIEDHILHCGVLLGRDVICDRGLNISRKSRKRWIALAKSLEVPVHARIFEVYPAEVHAKRRVDTDGRGATFEQWLEVFEYHQKQYEMPTTEEGFEVIIKHV
jgi:hypothetical protein